MHNISSNVWRRKEKHLDWKRRGHIQELLFIRRGK